MRFLMVVLFIYPTFSMANESCRDYLTSTVSDREVFLSAFEQQGSHFSHKQQTVWREALKHLVEDLEEVDGSSSKKDQLLKEEIKAVVEKLPEIFESWKKLETQDKTGYFKEGFLGVWATLTVHSHEMLESRKKEMDYQRLFAILKTIKDFDTSRAKFSFYKIRRAIQGRFSIKEYVNCKL